MLPRNTDTRLLPALFSCREQKGYFFVGRRAGKKGKGLREHGKRGRGTGFSYY